MPRSLDITPILEFLPCRTPDAWVEEAIKPENLETLLIDHANNELKAANNALSIIRKYGYTSPRKASKDISADSKHNTLREKKAAATALNLMFRYPGNPELLNKMSRLAREELRHFEQVLAIITRRGIALCPLSAGRYAENLRRGIRTYEPARQVDTLIVGAFIEARSCERFAALAPFVDEELQKFYQSLLKSESRHFQDYLVLAEAISDEPLDERIAFFAGLEQEAICSEDNEFRFHSGIPCRKP